MNEKHEETIGKAMLESDYETLKNFADIMATEAAELSKKALNRCDKGIKESLCQINFNYTQASRKFKEILFDKL